jgi:hypothetical protein
MLLVSMRFAARRRTQADPLECARRAFAAVLALPPDFPEDSDRLNQCEAYLQIAQAEIEKHRGYQREDA